MTIGQRSIDARCCRPMAVCLCLCGALIAINRTEFKVHAEERLLKSQLKDGSEVRAAFRDVVSRVNRSMVAVQVEGRQVSLGFIVGRDGQILTKASELGSAIRCRLRDGRVFDAKVVGVHDRYDVALLKIDAQTLPVVEWAEGRELRVGQWLATPGLEDLPVAVGIVSVPRRSISPEKGMLGVQLSDGTPGPRVIHVVPESPAARAGVQPGDTIVRAADQAVRDPQSFDHVIRKYAPGDTVNVVVVRQNREITLKAILGAPAGTIMTRNHFMNRMSGRISHRHAGFPQAVQHDTVLDPETCGGPVVDLSGQVVGMNIARAGRVDTFAVPTDVVQMLIKEVRGDQTVPAGVAPRDEKPDAPFVPPAPLDSPRR